MLQHSCIRRITIFPKLRAQSLELSGVSDCSFLTFQQGSNSLSYSICSPGALYLIYSQEVEPQSIYPIVLRITKCSLQLVRRILEVGTFENKQNCFYLIVLYFRVCALVQPQLSPLQLSAVAASFVSAGYQEPWTLPNSNHQSLL